MQGQDENDATQLPLRDVHAINNRIEFGSVPISPVEVRTQIPPCHHRPILQQEPCNIFTFEEEECRHHFITCKL